MALKEHENVWRFLILGLGLALMTSCDSSQLNIQGRVMVDGSPLDQGTVQLAPVVEGAGRGIGGSVKEGELQFAPDQQLSPGKYRIQVQGFKRTGRVVEGEPQGRKIDEVAPLQLADSPQEIEITRENHDDLTIEFNTKRKH